MKTGFCRREYSTKFYTGRLRPEVQPLTHQYTIFDRKGTPFTYLVYTFASLLTAVNALSFKQESITKQERSVSHRVSINTL